jgi:hypothetical protein
VGLHSLTCSQHRDQLLCGADVQSHPAGTVNFVICAAGMIDGFFWDEEVW